MAGSLFTAELDSDRISALQELLEERGWMLENAPYAVFRTKKDKVSVTAYESGKLVVQGKGTPEFLEFILEPEILGEVIKKEPADIENEELPQPIVPHGGIDESGKGDFFGPLVIAGVSVDAATGERLRTVGVCDSKKISSDKKILTLSAAVKECVGRGNYSVLTFRMDTYNRLYNEFGNLNRLLAWGHARIIENLLEQNPAVPAMLSDQFADPSLIQRALMERGRQIQLEQRTKAESDIAVAAASILARAGFVLAVRQLEEECGCILPKGAGPAVKAAAAEILKNKGVDTLRRCCKNHFKTFEEVLYGC